MRFGLVGRAALVGLAAALALAGCGGSKKTETPNKGGTKLEKTQINVGLLPIPDSAAVHIAIQKGYFAAEGLTVKPEIIAGGAVGIPRLSAGSLDVILGNYVSTFAGQEKGIAKFKIIADAAQAKPSVFVLMVGKDAKLSTPKDLKGKKVAVNTKNNIGTLAVTSTLKVHGLTANDITFIEVPFPTMAAALKANQVDAIWLTEPFITAAGKELGARVLADTMTGAMADFPIAGWTAIEDFVTKNPNTVAAFQRALAKAQQEAATDRKVVEQILPKYTKISAETAAVIGLPAFPTSLSETRLQRVADLMQENGYLKSKLDVKPLLVAPAG